MKQFVKTLPKRHPLSVEIRELYGAEGFTYLTDLLDLVQEIGYFELTPKIVARECGINAQKVARIFENLKRIFEESCYFLGLSSNKVERKLEETSKKVATFDAQNPHGSTRDLREEKNREEEINPSLLPPKLERRTEDGLFFEIDLHGQSMTEDQWIYRNIIEHRRSKGLKSQGGDDLPSLLALYPAHMSEYRRWVTLPMAKRIAAFAMTALEYTPDNQLRYALSVAIKENNPKFAQYLKQAEDQVSLKDYLVRING